MFEAAEVGRKISKLEYKARKPELRQELLQTQQELRGCDFPVVVVFAGVDGAGKGDMANLLHEWMDPRWLVTHAYDAPSQEEQERPEYWRYWRDLPPKGQLGIFLSSWYSRPVLNRVYERTSPAEFDEQLERVGSFEGALAADGALVVKFWMHLSRQAQKSRFKALEKDALMKWKVTKADWEHWRMYDRFVVAAERAIMKTSVGHAQWHIVEGTNVPYRSLTVGTLLLDAIRKHISARAARKEVVRVLDTVATEPSSTSTSAQTDVLRSGLPTVLSALDMDRVLDKVVYKTELKKWQGKLGVLGRKARDRKVSTLVVFEGWDAGGKGGAVRRCTAALDARGYEVIPFSAPTDEERRHHYLWRFWRRLGRAGRVTFFDRSWYGRVLVERVEGFATEVEWGRAYAEINDFEEQLVEHGIVLLKFWLHITPEEQLSRFTAREEIPWKSWKLTDEDWRNREKWADYEEAVNDMISHTSTSLAPWTLVEANDKKSARLKVLRTLCQAMETGVKAAVG